MSVATAPAAPASRVRAAVAPVLTAAVALGYVGIDLTGVDDPVLSPLPPLGHAALVMLQAVALLWRERAPRTVLGIVVALDLVILATSGGQLGIGALAVLIAVYAVWRRGTPGATAALVCAAVATIVVSATAMAVAGLPVLAIAVAAAARVIVLYVLPVGAAEYVRNRARLAVAERERAALLQRGRREETARALRAERTALARELHDIAGHHLSGIIVTAQAASALAATDPARTRDLLGSVQEEARTALADLRRTVGLLRDEGTDADGSHAPAAAPSLARVPELVAQARTAGRRVELLMDDALPTLSPLADAAVYRMVQESLANVAHHAPGAASVVRIESTSGMLRVIVGNDRPPAPPPAPRRTDGYGLAGMRERADLIGAQLTTGAEPDGGWCNELVVTVAEEKAEGRA
ncbi:histidine kinase [Microbacterium lushaniae]|nr:histidine kinase [Microbacterium lushaniae]KAA9150872.1 histidine kinase [Microbacterium lushaniae]